MARRKLVVIGMDAMDSRLALQWAREGYLPTLARLLSSGFNARIDTPSGVLEGAIWPTLLTGVSPASHGMFSFLQLKRGSYELRQGNRADQLTVAPFWIELSKAGKKVAIVDAPMSRPIKGLNGIQVVNWGAHDAPSSWERCSWPPKLIHDLVKRFGDHPVTACDAGNRTFSDYEDLRERLIAGVEKKTELLRYCLDLEDWDLFFGVYSESHCVGHQFWHLMDPTHPLHHPEAPEILQSAIRDVYQTMDKGLATLLEVLPKDTAVLVLLSHGMGPFYTGSHLIDRIIERAGINPPSTEPSAGTEKNAVEHSLTLREMFWECRRVLPSSARKYLKVVGAGEMLSKLWTWSHPPDPLGLKTMAGRWKRMRAFSVPTNYMTGAIRINLKGRDPNGVVQPGAEYNALCGQLSEVFLGLDNPATGRKAVQWAARASDFYQGPHLDQFPDLFIEWDHSAQISALRSPQVGEVRGVLQYNRTGSHMENSRLLGLGSSFRTGDIKEEIRTEDISATVLDFFGVPCPKTLEGRSMLPLLRPGKERYLRKNPAIHVLPPGERFELY
jgi:predicted AlkP superfamily phosphohydrolase/phosphomutase